VRVDEFDFELPESLIALRPAEPRDAARLLVVEPVRDGGFGEHAMRDLGDLLRRGDALVFNDTKVIPARLTGRRIGRGETAPRIEVTLHQRVDGHTWKAFARPARKLAEGDRIGFGDDASACLLSGLVARVAGKGEGGELVLAFDLTGAVLDEAIAAHGAMPLPPYIASRRAPDARDRIDYQTVYARAEGAVAAPTAGLHFTPRLLADLERRGISRHHVTLHVGAGTFLPVKVRDTSDHRMHGEWGLLDASTAAALNAVRDRGGRIVAVGTTSLRLLESAVDDTGRLAPFEGMTDIFITPGRPIVSADMLLTNFHLPRSTLFMLVCAFAGTDRMKRAYAHAIERRFRFYSYGDACLLTRDDAQAGAV
jgi:S-adenosylmethionine:tRNA ribosyltransferase-isomerase